MPNCFSWKKAAQDIAVERDRLRAENTELREALETAKQYIEAWIVCRHTPALASADLDRAKGDLEKVNSALAKTKEG